MHNNTIKALVVDDSSVIRRLMSIALERMGLEADFVENGEKALRRLDETNAEYDIIFLDIMMDGMDGYKVCKLIKSKPNTKEIPVIMLTSRDGAIDKIRGKLSGADHYLTKPVKMLEFKKTIRTYVPVDLINAQRKAVSEQTNSVNERKVTPRPQTPREETPRELMKTRPIQLKSVPSGRDLPKPQPQPQPKPKPQVKPDNLNQKELKPVKKELTREEKIAQIREMMAKK